MAIIKNSAGTIKKRTYAVACKIRTFEGKLYNVECEKEIVEWI